MHSKVGTLRRTGRRQHVPFLNYEIGTCHDDQRLLNKAAPTARRGQTCNRVPLFVDPRSRCVYPISCRNLFVGVNSESITCIFKFVLLDPRSRKQITRNNEPRKTNEKQRITLYVSPLCTFDDPIGSYIEPKDGDTDTDDLHPPIWAANVIDQFHEAYRISAPYPIRL